MRLAAGGVLGGRLAGPREDNELVEADVVVRVSAAAPAEALLFFWTRVSRGSLFIPLLWTREDLTVQPLQTRTQRLAVSVHLYEFQLPDDLVNLPLQEGRERQ